MKRSGISALLAAPLLSILLHTLPVRAADELEEQLKTEYVGKVLTLRHFYKGDHLVFQSDGSLIGFAEVGPWTVDGQISVGSVNIHHRALQIRGRRVCLVFDSKGRPARDVLTWLEESDFKDRAEMEQFFRKNGIEVEINLTSEKPSQQEISSAVNAVFLTPGDSIRGIVPDFWRLYFDQSDGQPNTRQPSEGIFLAGKGASAPQAIHRENPEFSEEARQARYQGTAILSLVVDPSGDVKDLAIVSPLGLGLDEKAVASVSTWKFKPGTTQDGEPVPVKLMVEVDFHLY